MYRPSQTPRLTMSSDGGRGDCGPGTGVLLRRRLSPESPLGSRRVSLVGDFPLYRVSKETMKVVVFHWRTRKHSHLCYTSHVSSQSQTRVKLNRVFFPRCCCQ